MYGAKIVLYDNRHGSQLNQIVINERKKKYFLAHRVRVFVCARGEYMSE